MGIRDWCKRQHLHTLHISPELEGTNGKDERKGQTTSYRPTGLMHAVVLSKTPSVKPARAEHPLRKHCGSRWLSSRLDHRPSRGAQGFFPGAHYILSPSGSWFSTQRAEILALVCHPHPQFLAKTAQLCIRPSSVAPAMASAIHPRECFSTAERKQKVPSMPHPECQASAQCRSIVARARSVPFRAHAILFLIHAPAVYAGIYMPCNDRSPSQPVAEFLYYGVLQDDLSGVALAVLPASDK